MGTWKQRTWTIVLTLALAAIVPSTAHAQYCSTCWAKSGPDFDDWITNVTFNTLNNDSGAEGHPCQYVDYTNTRELITTVNRGVRYRASVSVNPCNGSGNCFDQYVFIWIDWNQDADFDDTGEVYNLGIVNELTPNLTVDVVCAITVPPCASLGPTRMRVSERLEHRAHSLRH